MTVSAGTVQSLVTDPKLVGERREQIVRAAVKLFSEQGYFVTTIQQIAREAGISVGLVYRYFREKDDVLFLSLKDVLETYEREIPLALEGTEHPLERLRAALGAYRSTKSLRPERRRYIKEGETRTNRLLERCLRACIAAGYMVPVNRQLLVYQYVHFAHAWALKSWAFRNRYTLDEYIAEGMKLLVDPFLTGKGRAAARSLPSR